MFQSRNCSLISAILLVGAVTPAFCETVLVLKNGDRLTGKVVSEDTNQVVFATTWSQLTIPLEQITKRDQTTNAPVPAPAATNAPAAVAPHPPAATNTPATNLAAPAAPAGTNAPVPKAIAPAAPPVKTTGPKRWAVEISAGANLQYNQKSYENYYGLFRYNYNGEKYQDIVQYNAAYGRVEKEVSMNRMDGSWRVEYDFAKNKRAYVYNSVGGGMDEVRKIDLTYEDSTGVGYKFIQRPKFVLGGDLGLNYQEQFFNDDSHKDYLSLRVGQNATWKVTEQVTLDEKVEYYPRLTSWGDYVFRVEASATIKLNKTGSVFLNTAIIDTYDTRPATGVIPNDFQLRSSIGMKL